jgi:hypothetical protein
MSDYQRCKTCGVYGWVGTHRCPPVWECRRVVPWDDEEWTDVYATDARNAAEEFCDIFDSDGDYMIIRHGSATIDVRKKDSDVAERFEVSAESVPRYTAVKSPA